MTTRTTYTPKNAGFTFIEMGIVMVIIGLIIGGTIVALDMKRSAELRAILTQRGEIVGAVMEFKQKYNGLPGDLRNATSYWGAANADAAVCRITASVNKETCNGDGDKRVGENIATAVNESFRFWQQLGNAELIKGNYTGVAGSGGNYHHVRGTNALASNVSTIVWGVRNLDAYTGDATTYITYDYDNLLEVGTENSTSEPADGGGFSPEEALSIDTKADDGLPTSGSVIAGRWDNCTTAASQSDATATYDMNITDKSCSIIFAKQF
jgi:type II secretory pathway pseudopilin PulG